MGKHLTNFVDALIQDDNKKHAIVTNISLFDRNLDCLCREKMQMSKNKFCTKISLTDTNSYGINHRIGQRDKIQVNANVVLVKFPGKDHALIQPMGNKYNFIESDLNGLLTKNQTSAQLIHVFMLAKMGNIDVNSKPSSIKHLEDFIYEASLHETPKKASKIKRSL